MPTTAAPTAAAVSAALADLGSTTTTATDSTARPVVVTLRARSDRERDNLQELVVERLTAAGFDTEVISANAVHVVALPVAVAAPATVVVSPRENAVPCATCDRPTFAPNVRCAEHGSDVDSLGARLGRAREGYPVELAFAELTDPAALALLLAGALRTASTADPARFALVAA